MPGNSLKRRAPLALGSLTLALMMMGCEPPTPALTETPTAAVSMDVYRGGAIAQMVCNQCHDVGVAGLGPETKVGAPAFADVASRPGMTEEKVSQWMRETHPIMPTYMFNDANVDELAAYIMSLRRPS